jgi:organic hydroperoxide reductase OsmC/OhrA
MSESPHCELAVDWSVDGDGAITIPVPAPLPPELQFDRADAAWTAEHLLLASLGLSFTAAFYELARAREFAPRELVGTAEGLLEKEDGMLRFSAFTLWVRLNVSAPEKALAIELMESARRSCAAARELQAPLDIFHQVRVDRRGSRERTARELRFRAPLLLPCEWSLRTFGSPLGSDDETASQASSPATPGAGVFPSKGG